MILVFGAVSSAWLDPRPQRFSFGVKRQRSSLLLLPSSPCLTSSTHSSNWIDTFTGVRVAFPEGKHFITWFCLIEETFLLSFTTPPPFLIPLSHHARESAGTAPDVATSGQEDSCAQAKIKIVQGMGKLHCPKTRHEKTVSKMQANFSFLWKFSLTFIKDFEGGCVCVVGYFSILILLFKKRKKICLLFGLWNWNASLAGQKARGMLLPEKRNFCLMLLRPQKFKNWI